MQGENRVFSSEHGNCKAREVARTKQSVNCRDKFDVAGNADADCLANEVAGMTAACLAELEATEMIHYGAQLRHGVPFFRSFHERAGDRQINGMLPIEHAKRPSATFQREVRRLSRIRPLEVKKKRNHFLITGESMIWSGWSKEEVALAWCAGSVLDVSRPCHAVGAQI